MASRPSRDIYAETLAVFDRGEFEPLTTPEVADALEANRRTVYKRLETLVDRGDLETKAAGANARVWWRSPENSTATTPGSATEDGQGIVDEDGVLQYITPSVEDVLGYEPAELVGQDTFEYVHPDDREHLSELLADLIERSGGKRTKAEFRVKGADGSWIWLETIGSDERDASLSGYVISCRDITERKERQHELERTNRQLEAVLDTVDALIFIKDVDGRYQLLNDECREVLGLDPEEDIVGLTDEDLFPAETAEQYRADDRRALERGETIKLEEETPTPEGTRTNLTLKSPLYDENGEPAGVCAVSTDITDRKEREHELRTRSAAIEASVDGIGILDPEGEYVFVNQAHAEVYGYDDPDELLGETWRQCYDEDEVRRFENEIMPTLFEKKGWRGEATGRREDGTSFPQELSLTATDDGGIICVVRDITDRKERERELERQREQLAALDELNAVVQEITEQAIDGSTRREIEEVVCEGLAEADSYRFAWICAADSAGGLTPRMEAGVEGYLDDVPLSTEPDDPSGCGPTGEAARTQEVQVTRDVFDDADFEPWQEYAREYGYRSSAAIPIVHEGSLYGVIGVYTARSDAFTEKERDVIGQLSEVVGHAIAAVDRKRALMSDEMVELEFRIRDVEALDLLTDSEGTVVFDRTIPVGDGTYLEYGIATGDAMAAVRTLVDADVTPYSGAVNVIDRTEEGTRFELELAESPIVSAVTAHGGYVDQARLEEGKYYLRVHLTPGVDTHRIIDTVLDSYPETVLVTKRQTTRSDATPRRIAGVLDDRLTERQRAALEAGYFAGFFDWPRSSSGEDVADSLGISTSTFHEHVRKAEKKLLDGVFGS